MSAPRNQGVPGGGPGVAVLSAPGTDAPEAEPAQPVTETPEPPPVQAPARRSRVAASTRPPAARTSPPPLAAVQNASQLPDRRYFRIGEVAQLLGVKPYVLRYWETEFPQVRPQKSRSGQRLYRRREVELLLDIRHLLYERGFTIVGARKALKEAEDARASSQESVAPSMPPDNLSSTGHSLPPLFDVEDQPLENLFATQPPLTFGTSLPPPLPGPPTLAPPASHPASTPPAGLATPPTPPAPPAEQLVLGLERADTLLLEQIRDGLQELINLCKQHDR